MPTRDQLLQAARAQHSAGQWQAAQSLYQQILSSNANDVDAVMGLAALALQTRNFDVAIELFQRALQLEPNSVDAVNNLGVALAQRGRSDEAIDLWHRAASLNPSYADAFVNLTNMYRKLGRLEEAVSAGRRAVQLDPQHAEARSNLANVLSAQGRVDEAITEFRRAISTKPNAVRIHSNLLMNLHYSDSPSRRKYSMSIWPGRIGMRSRSRVRRVANTRTIAIRIDDCELVTSRPICANIRFRTSLNHCSARTTDRAWKCLASPTFIGAMR